MRSMQFGGKPIEVAPNRVFNCAYMPADDWRCFSETMFLLLGGTGVGYSVQGHHVEKLPEIQKPNSKRTRRYLIGDSIEGWADAVKTLMRSYFKGGSKLRFDFSHHKGLSEDEIKNIEGIVNNIINSNLNVETKIMKSEDAINLGALALFGEKYDDEVRVLSIGDNNSASYSLELCGGTHVEKTSEIGNFKIISESSAASGIRRIEALRGNDLISYNETKSMQIENDLEKNKIIEDTKKINLEIIKKFSQNIQERIKDGETLIVETCNNLKPKDLRSVVDQCKSQFLKDGVIVVGVIKDEKISFLVGVTNELSNNLSASEIALYAAKITNGRGGGGRKDFAQSGGTYSENINIKETLQIFLKENVSS